MNGRGIPEGSRNGSTPSSLGLVPAGALAGVELAPSCPPPASELDPHQVPAGALAGVELAPSCPPAIAGWAPAQLAMLDLFSGSGAASRAAAVRGWKVLRVDNGAGTAADVRADITGWSAPAERWDLVWASPPCTQLSSANQRTRDLEEGLVCVRAALRIVDEVRPRWWVLENVHGATRAIGDLIGPPVARYGSFYLWGVFPPFEATVPRSKTKLSGRRRAERRATIPWPIADGLVRACEAMAKELET